MANRRRIRGPGPAKTVEQTKPSGDGAQPRDGAGKEIEHRSGSAPEPGREIIPIRGAALKIVENMEASLSVPTATSQRRIPVKLLDENRRHHQPSSSGERSRQGFLHALDRLGSAARAR